MLQSLTGCAIMTLQAFETDARRALARGRFCVDLNRGEEKA
jgi:hypothetical protein